MKLHRIIFYILKKISTIINKVIPAYILKKIQNRFIYFPVIKKRKYLNKNNALFDTVFFEVRTKCNGTCSFCAASVHNDHRKDTLMSEHLYKKIINQLKAIPFKGRIAYHVNNDPLIFHNLENFIKYARKELPETWIQILTNGKALTDKKAENIIKAGINELSITYYTKNLKEPTPEKFINIKNNIITKFYNKKNIKEGHGPEKKNTKIFKFNVFKRYVDEILTSRAGTAPNKKTINKKTIRGFCEYPFTQFNITTDGTVSKCCADFYFSDSMGDSTKESILNIWYGKKFNFVRQKLLKGNRNIINTCKNCDFYGVKTSSLTPLSNFFYQLIQ